MDNNMLKSTLKKGLLSFLFVLACLSLTAVSLSSYAASTPRVVAGHVLDSVQVDALDERLEKFYQKTGIEFLFLIASDVQQDYNTSSIQELLNHIYYDYQRQDPDVKIIMVGLDDASNSYYYDDFGSVDDIIDDDALHHIIKGVLLSYEAEGRLYDGIMNTVDLVEAAVVDGDESIKMFDFANLLTDEQQAKIQERALALKKKYKMDFVFLISDGLGYPGEFRVYVLDLFHYSNYGYEGKKDGVFFAMDMVGRDYAVVTTGKAEDEISNEDLDKYRDRFVPLLSSGDYYRAVDELLNVLEGILSGKFNLEEKQGTFMMGLLISAVVALLITALTAYSQKAVIKKQNANDYVVPGSVHITHTSDQYTHTTTSRRKIKSESSNSSSGGGSFSGNSGGSGGGISGKF